GDRILTGAAMLEDAGPEQLAFAGAPKYFDAAAQSKAGCIITLPEFSATTGQTVLESPQPRAHFARALTLLYPARQLQPGVHPSAHIESGAQMEPTVEVGPFVTIGSGTRIGSRVRIGAGCSIGSGVEIGDDCVLHPRVSIYDRVTLGPRCILHTGA